MTPAPSSLPVKEEFYFAGPLDTHFSHYMFQKSNHLYLGLEDHDLPSYKQERGYSLTLPIDRVYYYMAKGIVTPHTPFSKEKSIENIAQFLDV